MGIQGLFGNVTEISVEEFLESQWAGLIIEGEEVKKVFKLIRDMVILTDMRIIDINKQGMTGKKTEIKSIRLETIFDVTMETAGLGIDDSELIIYYVISPLIGVFNMQLASRKITFSKKFNIIEFYNYMYDLAQKNYTRMNKLKDIQNPYDNR